MRPCPVIPRALLRGARISAWLCYPLPYKPADKPLHKPPHKPAHKIHPTKSTPRNPPHEIHPTKSTPRNHCAISQGSRISARFRRDPGSRRDFAGSPFSSGVALPELLVVRLAKRRPTAARHEQGRWDTT
jgi:hypothetical protein